MSKIELSHNQFQNWTYFFPNLELEAWYDKKELVFY